MKSANELANIIGRTNVIEENMSGRIGKAMAVMILLVSFSITLLTSPAHAQARRHYRSVWNEITCPISDDLHLIHFVNDSTGWIVTAKTGRLLETVDAGSTWTLVDSLPPGYYEAITSTRDGALWIAGDRGRLFIRRPGSDRFVPRGALSETISCYTLMPVYPDKDDSLKYRLFLGGVDLAGARPRPVLARSLNHGRTWDRMGNEVPGTVVSSLAISPLGFLYAASGGRLLTSLTGTPGTWITTYQAPGDSLTLRYLTMDLKVSNGAMFGVAVGHNGLVLDTFDGGRDWNPVPPFTGNRLRRALVLDSQTAWLVGDASIDQAVCWRTADRGISWQNVQLPYDQIDLHDITATSTALFAIGTGGTILTLAR